MLEPPEFDAIYSDSAHAGVARGNAENTGTAPNETIEVNTPLTMGGGTFAR
jgi:hypothetical protein